MKRIISFTLIALLGCVLVVAQSIDIGLDTSISATQTATLSASASQNLSLSLGLPMGKRSRLAIRGSGSVGLSFIEGMDLAITYPASVGEIDLQEFSWTFEAAMPDEGAQMLSVAIGRFPYTDPTGAIFSYRLDGLSIRAAYPALTIQAALGYTGLLPGSAPLIPTASDSAFPNDLLLPGTVFAHPRAVAAFTMRTPRIWGHELHATFIAQEDLRDASQFVPEYSVEQSSLSGPADRAYAAVGLTGNPPGLPISYAAAGAIQFGRTLSYLADETSDTEHRYVYAPVNALMLSAQAMLAITPTLSLNVRLQYGSGDADAPTGTGGNGQDDSTLFVAMTRSSSGMLFSPQAGNTSILSATLTTRPFPKVTIGPKAITLLSRTFLFAKNGKGPISEAGVLPDTEFSLLGLEQDFIASVRLLSDLTGNLSIGTFLPFAEPAGAFDKTFTEKAPIQFMIRAGISIVL
jgi:hypothetical protein